MNQKLANDKNEILGELRAIERDSKSAENSSDKVDALLKNNAAKSKLLKQQFGHYQLMKGQYRSSKFHFYQ